MTQTTPATESATPAARRPYARPSLDRRDPLGAIAAMPVVVSGPVPSDIRLKQDVTRIGTAAHGLPLYRFRYLDRPGVYEGVMAQEALRVMPEAVLRGEDGFLRVDYARLGVPFRRVQ